MGGLGISIILITFYALCAISVAILIAAIVCAITGVR